jgi:hypothetical protein
MKVSCLQEISFCVVFRAWLRSLSRLALSAAFFVQRKLEGEEEGLCRMFHCGILYVVQLYEHAITKYICAYNSRAGRSGWQKKKEEVVLWQENGKKYNATVTRTPTESNFTRHKPYLFTVPSAAPDTQLLIRHNSDWLGGRRRKKSFLSFLLSTSGKVPLIHSSVCY